MQNLPDSHNGFWFGFPGLGFLQTFPYNYPAGSWIYRCTQGCRHWDCERVRHGQLESEHQRHQIVTAQVAQVAIVFNVAWAPQESMKFWMPICCLNQWERGNLFMNVANTFYTIHYDDHNGDDSWQWSYHQWAGTCPWTVLHQLEEVFSCTYLDEKRSTMQNLNAKLLAHSIAWDGGEICLLWLSPKSCKICWVSAFSPCISLAFSGPRSNTLSIDEVYVGLMRCT